MYKRQGLNFEKTNPINRENLIFDISYYYTTDARDYDSAAIKYAFDVYGITWCINNNRAFWLAEFNYLNAPYGNWPGGPNNGPKWLRNTMAYSNSVGAVGYAGWSWNVEAGDPFYLLQNWYGTPSKSGSVLQEGLP